jgi:hypothetical protein
MKHKSVVSCYLSDSELAEIRDFAALEGVTVSAWVRDAVLGAARVAAALRKHKERTKPATQHTYSEDRVATEQYAGYLGPR